MALAFMAGSSAFAADGGVWSVSKSSGEVWITTTGAQAASLKREDTLKAGDTIRTGRNGRVLLVRGEETILIAPNSVIGVPAEKKDGMSTTIQQQAGSILLEVEKRNVKHFEVETPYLAAVVKGTHFSVTVNRESTRVEVRRGQVEVSDFKSGQIAQVMPGQAATSFTHGKPGLTLSGSGTFNPIEQGKPRASALERIPVPKGGLPAPRNVGNGRTIHALAPVGNPPGSQQARLGNATAKHNVIHISTTLGEVKLNVRKATHGLAHGSVTPGLSRSASRDRSAKDTIWSDSKSGTGNAYAYGQTVLGNGSATAAGSAAIAATVATTTGAASNANNGNGNGNGNGATGNGKIAGNGNNGNHGNGNNGNGNGGVGNGNGNGNAKH